MRRVVSPLIVVAIFGFVAAVLYRHLWDDPTEGTLANYLRSGVLRYLLQHHDVVGQLLHLASCLITALCVPRHVIQLLQLASRTINA